jgi:hypothetical protein
MNWIFILQLSITILVWLFSRWCYKYSEWLHYNKYVEIDSNKYPRLILFFINHFNKEGFFYYTFLVLIIIPIILAGLFIFYLLIMGGLKEFDHYLISLNWWKQLLLFMLLIPFYYVIKIGWDGWNRRLALEPKSKNDHLRSVKQKIKDIDKHKIQTYPRLTIYNSTNDENKDDQAIFDSVSFSKINKLLGVYDKGYRTNLKNRKEIEIDGFHYSILNMEINFLSVFEYFIVKRSDEKLSENDSPNLPYNIHIIINAKIIEK